ncbi:hypothetical protein ACLIYP_20180 [Streptomyces nanhaiensis]|uniref:hypothetical protein n=1 Tax=Streptomyces nanhaiensis TaxID=679319 RepID=UPI00399CE93D
MTEHRRLRFDVSMSVADYEVLAEHADRLGIGIPEYFLRSAIARASAWRQSGAEVEEAPFVIEHALRQLFGEEKPGADHNDWARRVLGAQ